MRIRRLSEKNADYLEGKEEMASKCNQSHVPKKLYQSIILNARTRTNRFNPTNRARSMNKTGKKIAWATSFPNIIKLTENEKKLQPSAFTTEDLPLQGNYSPMTKNWQKYPLQSLSLVFLVLGGKCVLCSNHGNYASLVTIVDDITLHSHVVRLCQNFMLLCAKFLTASTSVKLKIVFPFAGVHIDALGRNFS